MNYIYPENWIEPEKPEPVTLSPQERGAIKTRMKNYINNQDRPILLKELVQTSQDYILSNYGKHVKDEDLKGIAIEIQNEWHPPSEEVIE
jgi:hypothetical protein